MSESGELPAPRKARTLLQLFLGSFAFLVALSAITLIARPSLRKELNERLKYGTVSHGGLLLFLEPGEGRKLRLSVINTGDIRVTFTVAAAAAADELSVHVKDELGAEVPAVPTPPTSWFPVFGGLAWQIDLGPGERHTITVDLDRYVAIPGPGRYRVVVDGTLLTLWQSPERNRSNELWVDLK